jgi:hypothetical protein
VSSGRKADAQEVNAEWMPCLTHLIREKIDRYDAVKICKSNLFDASNGQEKILTSDENNVPLGAPGESHRATQSTVLIFGEYTTSTDVMDTPRLKLSEFVRIQ